jgi:glycyl-tRNA synthetase beta subunit
MPDLLLELFSEEIPARPSARSATGARTDKVTKHAGVERADA